MTAKYPWCDNQQERSKKEIRIVCISDTHTMGKVIEVPDGDMLIHAGDHTFRGTKEETKQAIKWLESQPHKYKLLVAGNHDFYFDDNAPDRFRNWRIFKPYTKWEMLERYGPSLTYLEDREVVIEGLKFYGSPWQPWFHGWAFNFPEPNIPMPGDFPWHDLYAKKIWDKIPEDVDVLITHSPPKGILDKAFYDREDDRVGCPHLRERINHLKNLRLHVFGHIHEQYGIREFQCEENEGYKWDKITFVNAALNTRQYNPTNPPIVVEI